jgi:hypothetical protein
MGMSLILDGSAGVTYPVTAGSSSPVQASSAKIIQVVNTMNGAVATGTTTIPQDDTIPQITEGTQFMTLAITPTSATSLLKIDVVINGAASSGNSWATALFQDSTANALAATNFSVAANNLVSYSGFTHFMTAGTTISTTFRVRCGTVTAGTFTFNGQSAGRIFGGVIASSITISEVAA